MVFQIQRLEQIWCHARGFYNCRWLYGYPLQVVNSDSECVIPAEACLEVNLRIGSDEYQDFLSDRVRS
jgi:hypothetical protein